MQKDLQGAPIDLLTAENNLNIPGKTEFKCGRKLIKLFELADTSIQRKL